MLNIILLLLSLFTLNVYGQCADTSDTNECARSTPGGQFDCCGIMDGGKCSPAYFEDEVCVDPLPSTTGMGTTPSGEPCICQSDEVVRCPPGVVSGSSSSGSSDSDSSASRRRRMESSSGSDPCGGSGSSSSSSSDDGVNRRRLIIRRLESSDEEDDGESDGGYIAATGSGSDSDGDGDSDSSGSVSSGSSSQEEVDDVTEQPLDDDTLCICTTVAEDAADDGGSDSSSSGSGSDSDGDGDSDSSDDVAVTANGDDDDDDDDDYNDAYRAQGAVDGSNMMISGVEGYHYNMIVGVFIGLICVIVW